ncbi:uncharacterized protein F5Z01DRAFT_44732 [Emericellopsis atlantica]|uniref:Transmembrane protein n=1 Tax=Emericellopsis atlantica TaxID=2614577 RepID=A0A9P7ZNN6_9HYPO|nr:uncharacterized protein F5Z01DRAFT_44732 [Emericellopsis atlantica]KAG9255266.1 hypothetical protein F5Z01DRAFT_44732 [Emericellopsis atlantica]
MVCAPPVIQNSMSIDVSSAGSTGLGYQSYVLARVAKSRSAITGTFTPATMAEPTAVSVIIEPLSLIFGFAYSAVTSIHYKWWILHMATVVAFPFQLLLIPLRIVTSVLSVVFAPFIYLGYCFIALASTLWTWLASLEPLYTFVVTAATIGISAGVVLALVSNFVSTKLSIQDSPYDDAAEDSDGEEISPLPKRRFLSDRGDSDEADWQWLETSTSPVRRKRASGLLSQTIHEEDDSSDA